MRKILFGLFTIVILASCEYCIVCGEYPCVCHNSKYVSGNNGSSDYFSASTLVGEWQMSGYHDEEYMNGCGIIPKSIVFGGIPVGSFGRCTITYMKGRNPQWYQMDLHYNYVRRELTFYGTNELGGLVKLFSFTYREFLFPTLTIEDSFGKYEWNKVRTTVQN